MYIPISSHTWHSGLAIGEKFKVRGVDLISLLSRLLLSSSIDGEALLRDPKNSARNGDMRRVIL